MLFLPIQKLDLCENGSHCSQKKYQSLYKSKSVEKFIKKKLASVFLCTMPGNN